MADYLMRLSATGNARDEIGKLADGVGKVTSQVQQLGHAAEETGKHVGEIAKNEHAEALFELSDKLHEAGEKAFEFSHKIIEAGKEMFDEAVHTASEFEDIKSSMVFSFGADADYMYEHTGKLAQTLAMTMKQSSDLVANLGRSGINAFGGMDASMQQFHTKTGGTTDALHILQDTVTGLGLPLQDAGRLLKGVHEGVTGNMREFKALAFAPKVFEELKAAAGGAGTQQEKYNKMIEVMGKTFGGFSETMKSNYSFAFAQIKDRLELLQGAIAGGEGLKAYTAGINYFTDALAKLLENKEAMEALRSAFSMLEHTAGFMFKMAGKVIEFTTAMLAANPMIAKFAVFAAIAAAGAGLFMGALLTLAGVAVAVAAAFAAIGWEAILAGLAGTAAFVVAMGPLLAAMAVAAGVVFLLFETGAQATKDNWGGIGDIFNKIKITVVALGELLSSYNGDTAHMSGETARALKDAGMEDFVKDVMGWFNKLNHGWISFKDTLDDSIDLIKPTFIPMIEEMKDLFYELADAFGFTDAATKANNSTNGDWQKNGKGIAETLIDITKATIGVIRFVVGMTRAFIAFSGVKQIISAVVWVVKELVEAFSKAAHFAGKLGEMIGLKGAGNGGMNAPRLHGNLVEAQAPAEAPNLADPFSPNKRYANRPFHDSEGRLTVDPGAFSAMSPDAQNDIKHGRVPTEESPEGTSWEQQYRAPRTLMPIEGLTGSGRTPELIDAQEAFNKNPNEMTEHQRQILAQGARQIVLQEEANRLAKLTAEKETTLDGNKLNAGLMSSRAQMSGEY